MEIMSSQELRLRPLSAPRLRQPRAQSNRIDHGRLHHRDNVPDAKETRISLQPPKLAGPHLNLNGQLRQECLIHTDKEMFWSESMLKDILTTEHIMNQLEIDNPTKENNDIQAEQIQACFLKVFAILAQMGKTAHILDFMKDGVTDDSLPLCLIDRIDCQISRKSTPELPIPCFNSWQAFEREDFVRRQHRVNPAFLDMEPDRKTIKHEVYENYTVLPFLEDGDIECCGYGVVAKVKIDPSSHGFRDVLSSIDTKDYFALKRILVTEKEQVKKEIEFWKEVEALKKFNGFVHEHLVTLLMTWTVKNSLKDQYCLLFPLAGDDMDNYWKKTQAPFNGPNPDIEKIRWVAKQILGMAGALDTIHNPRYSATHLAPKKKYGRHGDIKPENVLWYPSPNDKRGIWVIADLGLTVLNGTVSRSIPNQGIPVSPGYRPPECDLAGGKISQAFDIWTFGCLLLEMVCWALGGERYREDFEDYRTTPYITNLRTNIFFDIKFTDEGSRYTIMVKEEVHKWIVRLHNRPLCTQFFHELLDLIENEMIITLSATQTRIKSAALLERVNSMYKRVADPTDSYCQYVCPKTRTPKIDVPVKALLNDIALGLVNARNPAIGKHIGRTQTPRTPDQLEAMC